MQTLRIAALALVLGGLAASASAQTSISANVVTNTTWGPGEYVLQAPIFVKDGATLTILPGTIVRGQPRTGAVSSVTLAGSPGGLIITQTGRLIAEGNALQPIIFTTAATDNDNNGIPDNIIPADAFLDPWESGDLFLDDTPGTAPLAPVNKVGAANVSMWGGLVLLGNAPTNLADLAGVGYGKGTVEGLVLPATPSADATYGGLEPHDNSGSLKFVSVRHGGDELLDGNELNGFTLAGVGDGTVLENLEVYCNFDDGFEWFGGTVNGKNLAAFFAGDDSFDMDQGYTGVNQFMFAIMPFFNRVGGNFGSASGDKAGELDGDDFRPDPVPLYDNVNIRLDVTETEIDTTPWPLSSASLYNLTVIGTTPDVANPALPLGITAASANRGVQMRNGFAGSLLDSIVVNTGSAKGIDLVLVVDDGDPNTDDLDGAPGFDVVNNANAGLLSVYCSTFQNTGAIASPASDAELTAIANGNNVQPLVSSDNNVVNSASFNGLQNESTYFDPTGNAAGKLDPTLKATPINPRPNSGLTGTAGCRPPQGPGLSGVVYRGAFERVAPTLWTTDWTSLSIGGILAD